MKLQRQAEIDKAMSEYFNSINELDILEQDKERVQSAEKRSRSDVINLVKKYNGNMEQFYYGGGSGALETYKNNVMESEEVKNAIANKMQYAQWQHAQANGLFVKEVGVDVPVIDEEGNITKERKKVSMDEAWGLFENGHIDKLPYDGAEKDIDVGPDMFQKFYKDPRNPWSSDNLVTPQDVYLWVRERGGSDDQARAKMNKYTEYVNQGGTEWRYKADPKINLDIKQAQLRNMNQQYKRNKMQMEQNLTSSAVLDFQSRIRNAGPGQDIKLLPEEEKFFAGQFGFVWDKDKGQYTTTRDVTVFDRWASDNQNPRQYKLRDFLYIPITDYYQSEFPQTYINDQINVRQNAYFTPNSAMVTNQERDIYYSNLYNGATDAIMGTTGASEGEAGMMYYNYATQNDQGRSYDNPYAGGTQSELQSQQR